MKKLFIPLCAVAFATASFTSCLDSETEGNHMLTISHPSSYEADIYADQLTDSILFYTTESCSITSTDASWLTIPESMQKISLSASGQSVYYVSVPLTFTANTTGTTRKTYVYIKPTSGWNSGNYLGIEYLQASWLNITYPSAQYSNNGEYKTKATFECTTDSALQEKEYLSFTAYGNWTLATDSDSFAHPSISYGQAGEQAITLTLDKNLSYTDTISTTLRLTSNGVTNSILYRKAPRKKVQ